MEAYTLPPTQLRPASVPSSPGLPLMQREEEEEGPSDGLAPAEVQELIRAHGRGASHSLDAAEDAAMMALATPP
jgi:hypothetical protein